MVELRVTAAGGYRRAVLQFPGMVGNCCAAVRSNRRGRGPPPPTSAMWVLELEEEVRGGVFAWVKREIAKRREREGFSLDFKEVIYIYSRFFL